MGSLVETGMRTEVVELLIDLADALDGHGGSAYCQTFDDDDDTLVRRVRNMYEVKQYIKAQEMKRMIDDAKREKRWCEECKRVFRFSHDLKMHNRAKH